MRWEWFLARSESTPESRREWIGALDLIESLRPRAVGSSSHSFMLIVGIVEMIVGLHLNGALNAQICTLRGAPEEMGGILWVSFQFLPELQDVWLSTVRREGCSW